MKRGCEEQGLLRCLDQADRCKTLDKDMFGVNDALVARTINVLQILNSFIDRSEKFRGGRAHYKLPNIVESTPDVDSMPGEVAADLRESRAPADPVCVNSCAGVRLNEVGATCAGLLDR